MKKQFGKLLSLVLAMLIIAMSLPLSALADIPSVYGRLYLNQTLTVESWQTKLYYEFYTEEAGIYLFSSTGNSDTAITVFDSNNTLMGTDDDNGINGNFYLSLTLSANSLYYVKLANIDWEAYNVTVTKPELATDLKITDTESRVIDSIFAHINEKNRYLATLLPEGSVGEKVEWSIADTNIASVTVNGEVSFLNAGETTLTATAGDISKTVNITVAPRTVITLDSGYTIPANTSYFEHYCIDFTAPESGPYRFNISNNYGIITEAYNSYGVLHAQNFNLVYGTPVELTEGETVTFKVTFYDNFTEDYYASVESVTYTESVDIFLKKGENNRIFNNNFNFYQHDKISLGYETYPENSYAEYPFTFISEDPSIASVTEDGYLELKQKGTTNIFVSDGSAISSYISVTVVGKDTVLLDTGYSVSTGTDFAGIYIAEFFIPLDENNPTANFKATFEANSEVNVKFLDYSRNPIDEGVTGLSGVLTSELDTGDFYEIRIEFTNPSPDNSCVFKIESFTPMEDAEITDAEGVIIENDYYCRLNDVFKLSYKMLPEGSDGGNLIFSSNSSDILAIDESGNATAVGVGSCYVYLTDAYTGNTYDNLRIEIHNDSEILLNETKVILMPENLNNREQLLFTPEADGYYYFTVGGDYGTTFPSVCDQDNTWIHVQGNEALSDLYYKYTYYFTAGNVYRISLYDTTGYSYYITVNAYDVPNSVYVTDNEGARIDKYDGFSGTSTNLYYAYDSINAFRDDGVWTSSNSDIVSATDYGYIELLKAGSATVTFTSKSGFSVSIPVTVSNGKDIYLNNPVAESFTPTYNTVKYVFTPSATGYYEFASKNDGVALSASDSEFNPVPQAYSSDRKLIALLTAGETYYLKAVSYFEYCENEFTVSDRTAQLNNPQEFSIPEAVNDTVIYFFTPEKSGHYQFIANYLNEITYGLNINIYSSSNELLASYEQFDTYISSTVKLNANEIYRIEINKNCNEASIYSFIITETVGLDSLTISQMPYDTTVYEGSGDYNFSGLILSGVSSNNTLETVEYSPDSTICGFRITYFVTYEKEGFVTVTFSAGGAKCAIEYTIKQPEILTVNSEYTVSSELVDSRKNVIFTFTPETSATYNFKGISVGETYSHIDVFDNDGLIAYGHTINNSADVYVQLEAGVQYRIVTYNTFYQPASINFSVSEAVAIASMSVKVPPTQSFVYEDSYYNVNLTGLVLEVITTDGRTYEWSYDNQEEQGKIWGFAYTTSHDTPINGFAVCIISAGGASVDLTFEVREYPLVSIEAITSQDIYFVKDTDANLTPDGTPMYNLNSEKVAVKLNYKDGTSKFVELYSYVDGSDVTVMSNQYEAPWTECGKYFFTIYFKGKTTEVPVEIVNKRPSTSDSAATPSVEITDMKLVGDTELIFSESFIDFYKDGNILVPELHEIQNFDDVKVEITFSNGQKATVGLYETINGYDIYPDISEAQAETVWQGGNSYPITITAYTSSEFEAVKSITTTARVLSNGVAGIEITKTPDLEYVLGDSSFGYNEYMQNYYLKFESLDGFELLITYDDGSTKTVAITDNGEDICYIDGYHIYASYYGTGATAGDNQCFLVWNGCYANFTVNVKPSPVSGIEVVKLPVIPENLVYYSDMVGLELKVNFADGSSKNALFTAGDIEYYLYNGNIGYAIEFEGNRLTVEKDYNGYYKVRYYSATTQFVLVKEPHIYNLSSNIDFASKIANVSFAYDNNGMEAYEELVIDFSNADVILDNGTDVCYRGSIFSDKGIILYTVSRYYYSNDGKTRMSVSLLGNETSYYILPNYGDINGDGEVDIRDLIRMKKILAGAEENNTIAPMDFNGDNNTTTADMVWLRKALFGMFKLSCIHYDVNGDGGFNAQDALAIATYLAGNTELITSRADINRDGVVDQKDLDLINQNFY